ncbi:TPR repeat [Granulicella sibirica]|uniref:TPR repeat n=1 Tax=Granulicella sibirica TaxID=2479048 RepID=A0A4Q0SZ05_9BACT|nr:TPR repeat [Granulicella sibirica]
MLCYQRALAIKPDFFEAHNGVGNVFQAQGRFAEAAASYARAVSLAPRNADLWGNLASAFQGEGKVDEAIASYRMAVELRPDFATANYNLGTALFKNGELEEAAGRLEAAVRANPEYVLAHNNLGNAYKELERFEEAMACYERALALKPDSARAHYDIGCLLGDLGDCHGALKRYEMALAIQPDDAQVQFSMGLLQVMRGEFETGWRNYERRWHSHDHDTPERGFPQPPWAGEKLEAGRLLLWAEQGVGDEIMFAGLVAEAVRTGNDCILDCDPRLRSMFARSFPEVEVVSGFDATLSLEAGVAAQIPVASLPRLFRRSEAEFGRTDSPYLFADSVQRRRLRERYTDGRPVVGVAWFTRGKKTGQVRSAGLGALEPLFGVPNVRWMSLQYGDPDVLQAEINSVGAPVLVDRDIDQMKDMDGFAAQVAAMDLVITIDSSAAHLAGALGVRCWVMLPFAADWRWLGGRDDSPWYPGMRLFRQRQRGEWGPVVEKVREALAEFSQS